MEQDKREPRAIVEVIVEARKRKWSFITIDNFVTQTGLTAERVKEILLFLKSAEVLQYEYLPFGETKKKDIFNKELDDELDEEGAITFIGQRTNGATPTIFVYENKMDTLENFLVSDELYNKALKKAKYRIALSYDKLSRKLNFKEKEIAIERSHNQRVLCEVIFSKPFGTHFMEDDFKFDDIPEDQDEQRRTINVINQVNLKIEKITGIHQFIEFKGGIISTK